MVRFILQCGLHSGKYGTIISLPTMHRANQCTEQETARGRGHAMHRDYCYYHSKNKAKLAVFIAVRTR